MHKTINGLTPDYLSNLFTKTAERHNYISLDVNLTTWAYPEIRSDFKKRSISYNGAVFGTPLQILLGI